MKRSFVAGLILGGVASWSLSRLGTLATAFFLGALLGAFVAGLR